MNRWTHLIGALMLVLMLWTGGAAHAADQDPIVPVTVEATRHFDGDGDQSPSDKHQRTAHHHAGCGDHQVAARDDGSAVTVAMRVDSQPVVRRDAPARSRNPDNHLRPPIA